MSNVAAIDIGTNSVRLLIVDENGRELERSMRITRLGQGVDVSGALAPEAMARTLAVLEQYRVQTEHAAVQRLRVTATSAARDAANREQLFDRVERALGVRPELLPGDEEARLSFQGATSGLPLDAGPFFIMDIGGGSTELALGLSSPEVVVSLQLGCVRMTERHLKTDPPTKAELEACIADIRRELGTVSGIDIGRAKKVIGLAGTVTAVSALRLGLREYDAKRTHHSTLSLLQVKDAFRRLSQSTLAQRRELLAEPQRADVIVGGSAVLLTVMRYFGIAELLVSEHDILDGLAASLATQIPKS